MTTHMQASTPATPHPSILVPLPDARCRERILRVHMGAEHTTVTNVGWGRGDWMCGRVRVCE